MLLGSSGVEFGWSLDVEWSLEKQHGVGSAASLRRLLPSLEQDRTGMDFSPVFLFPTLLFAFPTALF